MGMSVILKKCETIHAKYKRRTDLRLSGTENRDSALTGNNLSQSF